MNVVILHDWLTGFRGGERVLETLCEMYPKAPIYTLIHKKGSTSNIIESRTIHTSFLNKIPGIYEHYKKYLPIMPCAVEMINLPEDTDLVISSSHCVIKGVRKPKKARHICYIHSPMRYMYDQFENYFRSSPFHIKLSAWLFKPFLRWWDKKSNKNVDFFIPNSQFVQKRVQRYYERGSCVVHPFVDLKDFDERSVQSEQREDHYLMVSAFAPNKRLDIAINAFNRLDQKLKIIGRASEKELKHFKGLAKKDNIEFLGELPREDVIQHFRRAKGFIFPGVEDFGITPLEAMAAGTPIIAYGSGGVLETMTHDTGVFFSDPTPHSLSKAVKRFEQKSFDPQKLLQRAHKFSKESFIKNMNGLIQEQIS